MSHKTWSIGLGSWGGLHIRIHCFFLLFAAFTMFLGWQAKSNPQFADEALIFAGGSLCILLVSVFLHELGHYLTAVRYGGGGHEVVLGPLGGLSTMRPPLDARHEMAMHLAGPGVNLALGVITGAALAVNGTDLTQLLFPLTPNGLVEGQHPWILACKLTFWINWVLLLVNLLPAFPFDGGRALKAALLSVSPDKSERDCSLIVATIAKITAAGLLLTALVLMWRPQVQPSAAQVPPWFALILLAIFLYFSAKQEAEREREVDTSLEPFGYDFSQGYTSLNREDESLAETAKPQAEPGLVQRWLAERRRARLARQQEIELAEEAQVDEILSRLHSHGYESLSEKDRSLLDRVSARYRTRNER